MENVTRDELSIFLQEPEINHRNDIWLWFFLSKNNIHFSHHKKLPNNMRVLMAIQLSRKNHSPDDIKQTRKKYLLPEKNLKWITNEKRQIIWLERELSTIWERPRELSSYLSGRDYIVAIIDLWEADPTPKTTTIKNIEEKWKHHNSENSILEWFKDDNRKCVLAWEWLEKHPDRSVLLSKPFKDYEDLLIFFDQANITQDRKILCLEKTKKKWSQKKYRENLTGKSQYNFILSDESINTLNTLSKKIGISRARTLELLLDMESENHVYTPRIIEMIKLIKNL